MRFEVSQVMDTIEPRLTTDVTIAQAVVDLGEVARCVELDTGRTINLVRIGMVVDALSRYLVDGGAMLYGVAGRELLSESALTSKERMVLGRWADDGLIEVVPVVGDRAVEVADLTGLPLIALHPYPKLVKRFSWLTDGGRVLRLAPRGGVATLRPMDEPAPAEQAAASRVIGRAKVPVEDESDDPTPADGGTGEAATPTSLEVFADRGAGRTGRTRISRRRFLRAEPGRAGVSLLTRQWRCDGFDCPVFGERRRIGQPVPLMRSGVPVCPRHNELIADVGPRPPAYPISIVVDDLPRRRLVVRAGEQVQVGRADDDPEVTSVAQWLHEAAAAWISPIHLRLESTEDGLVVTDLSDNGTVVWQRARADDHGTTAPLHRASYTLGEWDSLELYTGIELMRGDQRRSGTLGREEPASVLVDAPTAALQQLTRPGG